MRRRCLERLVSVVVGSVLVTGLTACYTPEQHRRATPVSTRYVIIPEAVLFDLAANVIAGASAYAAYGSRSRAVWAEVGRTRTDPVFRTRVVDFKNAAERAAAYVQNAVVVDAEGKLISPPA